MFSVTWGQMKSVLEDYLTFLTSMANSIKMAFMLMICQTFHMIMSDTSSNMGNSASGRQDFCQPPIDKSWYNNFLKKAEFHSSTLKITD